MSQRQPHRVIKWALAHAYSSGEHIFADCASAVDGGYCATHNCHCVPNDVDDDPEVSWTGLVSGLKELLPLIAELGA